MFKHRGLKSLVLKLRGIKPWVPGREGDRILNSGKYRYNFKWRNDDVGISHMQGDTLEEAYKKAVRFGLYLTKKQGIEHVPIKKSFRKAEDMWDMKTALD